MIAPKKFGEEIFSDDKEKISVVEYIECQDYDFILFGADADEPQPKGDQEECPGCEGRISES